MSKQTPLFSQYLSGQFGSLVSGSIVVVVGGSVISPGLVVRIVTVVFSVVEVVECGDTVGNVRELFALQSGDNETSSDF